MWGPTAEAAFSRSSSYRDGGGTEDDEEALRWAAIERLPTFSRVRRGIYRSEAGEGSEVIDVAEGLEMRERRRVVLERVVAEVGDAEMFLARMRQRFDEVDLKFPKIEVRFNQLKIDSMTLLLGPPSSGKTTLLLALAGRLGPDLQISGEITYNGHRFNEFVPQRTSAYVSQHDWHVAEATVREALEFSGRCQGVGIKYDMLMELSRREKNAGIKPDEDLDIFMKGPRDGAVDFFATMGFKCPARKNVADFLQEVTSKKDQRQYWSLYECPYHYISVSIFAEAFRSFHGGKRLSEDLSVPYDRRKNHPAALSTSSYALGKQQAVVSKEELRERDQKKNGEGPVVVDLRSFLSNSLRETNDKGQRGMVLPFQPLSMCFSNINYYVDIPMELKQQGIVEDRLQLLVNVTGAFRPGILTALVGVSGAGKTTLMDVLAGRKTGGLIEGSITISGYPKNQATFARISGYCEQNDVHSPCVTVHESLLYSAWLRLPSHVDLETQQAFVEEVMELVELIPLKGALVGLPGVNGLSTEQRKRLTIAVELVANPSIVFMDEPTSGLDARSAAIVMRTVRNIVNTGRTIVCTIHQPSIDIFESFDELLFMKRGGELIYAGPLGTNSRKLVDYFEAVSGVPKIRDGYNPAAWMLEVTSSAEENRLGVDFAEYYRRSKLFQKNKELIERLSKPSGNSKDLSFPTKYSQSFLVQFRACLWKHNLSYWRNPQYTAVRFFYTVVISLMFGTICWRLGSKRETQQDIFNAMGSMYAAVLFIGITNATAVQPVVSIERFVSYRERVAGMYSALPFAFAQRLPGWWRWYYWANPMAWSLYGLLTSQFGDVDEPMKLADGVSTIRVGTFLEEHFGFRHDRLFFVGFMVVGFSMIFAVIFAFAIRYLNFQRR
ncbi:Pleiotropic drug resistance protein 6 [Acorus calamus]|uniref:Pleiotropic drug resistance protein 6 n=1 Tax=Acorus calamus TaxID=4465 RepID=A0AAV9C2E3_ACOCL|nr:Pleiotropic drug resistance protein 6 [Acorus calamus]